MELSTLSMIILAIAVIAILSSLHSDHDPYKKKADNTKKYDVTIKDMKGEVHVKDK